MKFTPEVIAALETLRQNAENDFELHRISVLEKDLIAPPVVEVIDDKHVRFDGLTYASPPAAKGYFHKLCSLHRVVFTYYYGEIPEGHDIHHKDRNPSNNDISNLMLLSKTEHREIHRYSKRGIKHQRKKFICIECGKEYEAKLTGGHGNKFCSQKCNYKYNARLNGVKPHRGKITSICQHCGNLFEHYASVGKGKYCSSDCAHAAKKGIRKTPPKICAWWRVSAILCKLTITWLAGAIGHRTYTKLFTLSLGVAKNFILRIIAHNVAPYLAQDFYAKNKNATLTEPTKNLGYLSKSFFYRGV